MWTQYDTCDTNLKSKKTTMNLFWYYFIILYIHKKEYH